MKEGNEYSFFSSNLGKHKLFPGGPSWYFNGIEVPAFVTFTDHGGIDGIVLTEIFQRIDNSAVYDANRKDGRIPFALLDGHQSRFDLGFLQYISDTKTKWSACLGVPYGTALWQVGDSSEQNDNFKMLLNWKKRELFQKRLNTFTQKLHLVRSDIIPLVNWV